MFTKDMTNTAYTHADLIKKGDTVVLPGGYHATILRSAGKSTYMAGGRKFVTTHGTVELHGNQTLVVA